MGEGSGGNTIKSVLTRLLFNRTVAKSSATNAVLLTPKFQELAHEVFSSKEMEGE